MPSDRKPWACRLPISTIEKLKSLSASSGKSQADIVSQAVERLDNKPQCLDKADQKEPLSRQEEPPTSRHSDPAKTAEPSPALTKALTDLASLRTNRQPITKPSGKL